MANVSGINLNKIKTFADQIAPTKRLALAKALTHGNVRNLYDLMTGKKTVDEKAKDTYLASYRTSVDEVLPIKDPRTEMSYRRFFVRCAKKALGVDEKSELTLKHIELNEEQSYTFLNELYHSLTLDEINAIIAWYDVSEDYILTRKKPLTDKARARREAVQRYNERRRANGYKPLKAYKDEIRNEQEINEED